VFFCLLSDEISSSDESEIKDPNPEVLLPSRPNRSKQESALRRKREGEADGSEQPVTYGILTKHFTVNPDAPYKDGFRRKEDSFVRAAA
jgi:hypothetical protein